MKIYSVKWGPLGRRLYATDEETGKLKLFRLPKKSVVGVKAGKKDFIVFINNRIVTGYNFDNAWFEGNILFVENLKDGVTMQVDCLTGANSPLYKKRLGYSYYIDRNDRVMIIHRDMSYEKTNLKLIDEENLIFHNEKNDWYLQFQSDIMANITHKYSKDKNKEL